MSGTDSYEQRLKAFYHCHGLRVDKFQCSHTDQCREKAKCKLSQGAEAHLGKHFGQDLRVVVVSLDTGGTSDAMENRRREIEAVHFKGPENPHMKGTKELLEAIFGNNENVFELYAMTNAAKCSRGDDSSSDKVPDALYKNCKEYVLPELECLDPQLIVTQGAKAWEALKLEHPAPVLPAELDNWIDSQAAGSKVVHGWLKSLAKEYLNMLRIADRDVPIMKTIHPSARQGQWGMFVRTALQPIVAMAKCLAAQN